MVHSTNAPIFPYTAFVELRIWDRDYDIDVYIYNYLCSILDIRTEKNENKIAMDTFFIYTILALILYGIIDNWCSSISFCLLLPLYGLVCWIGIKLFRKYSKEDKREMQVRQSDIIFGCIEISVIE